MKKYLLTGCLLTCIMGATAQQLAVVHTESPESVSFATPFTAQVVLSHPQESRVTIDKESVPAEFALQAVQLQPVGIDTTQATFTVLPFTLQKSTFTVSFALEGNPQHRVQASLPLTVTPVKLFEDNELREIRPPHRVVDWVSWLCVLLALFALICLLIFGWRKWHANQSYLLSTPVDNRPPHVIALAQIDSLLNSGLWENKQYKAFYITLTDILRVYLQRAFGLDVSADTSAELLRRLKNVTSMAAHVQAIRSFLASGDLVKFAKQIPSEETRNRDITILRKLIDDTAPKPVSPTTKQEVSL